VVDNTLWTETPAERQQRLADEVMGKKRRVENADPDQDATDADDEDARKRRKREAELQRQVDEHTVRCVSVPPTTCRAPPPGPLLSDRDVTRIAFVS